VRCPHDSDPLECLSHVPYLLYFSISCALFCTFLRSPKTQLFYFQAIPHSASKKLNHRAWGRGQFASGKYGKSFRRYIFTSLHLASSPERKQHRLGGRTIGDGLEFRVLPPERLRHLHLRSLQDADELQGMTTDLP